MSVSELWQRAYMQELQRLSADNKLTPIQRVDAASCVADLSIEAYRARFAVTLT